MILGLKVDLGGLQEREREAILDCQDYLEKWELPVCRGVQDSWVSKASLKSSQ